MRADPNCELCGGSGVYSVVVVDEDSNTWDEYNADCECLVDEDRRVDADAVVDPQ